MKLRKLLAVTAVVAAMTAAFAVSAMAETTNKFTNFKYEDGVITLNANADADQIPVQSEGPYTMLVVRVDSEDLSDTSIADADIKQIDESNTAFSTITVGELAAGTYEIRLGGDGEVRWGTLTVAGAGSEYYDDGTRLLGDVTDDDKLLIDDSSALLVYLAAHNAVNKDTVQSMDITDDGKILIDDSSELLVYLAAHSGSIGTKTIAEKSNFISVE